MNVVLPRDAEIAFFFQSQWIGKTWLQLQWIFKLLHTKCVYTCATPYSVYSVLIVSEALVARVFCLNY